MVLQASGTISLLDIATEFQDTPPYSLSEFYRNGGLVPSNNVNVPTSGAISFQNFYGAVREIIVNATSAASLNAQTAFGTNWTASVPKRLIIPTGVTIGPLTIPTGLASTLIVQNEGEIQGLGGAVNSGAGGNAITASSSFSLVNSGAVRGGGGGGGRGGTGGTGGAGQFTTTEGPIYQPFVNPQYLWYIAGETSSAGLYIYWNSGAPNYTPVYEKTNDGLNDWLATTSVTVGGYTYTRGTLFEYNPDPIYYLYSVSRSFNTSTSGGAGGTGGNGGVGRGYGQSLASGSTGSAGSAGGTNAGTGGAGGTGGTGGDWATSGATGSTGATGTSGNVGAGLTGSAGSSGGAAGRAVQMLAGSLTLTNTGTINGAT